MSELLQEPKNERPAIVAGKDQGEVDNDYLLIPVNILDHEGPLSSSFPIENRLLPQGDRRKACAVCQLHTGQRRTVPWQCTKDETYRARSGHAVSYYGVSRAMTSLAPQAASSSF